MKDLGCTHIRAEEFNAPCHIHEYELDNFGKHVANDPGFLQMVAGMSQEQRD